MDVRKLIMDSLDNKKEVRSSEIVKATGFSRAYINRFFQELRDEGLIVLVGKANRARYIAATERAVKEVRKDILSSHRILKNENISEDVVLEDIKKRTGIFLSIRKNVSRILSYAFLEMLNNAIEHSESKIVEVTIKKEKNNINFDVIDKGVGIFNNIMRKRKLNNEMEAIQDLLKGKQSTSPETHSGEGIFFTSKVADIFTIQSSRKKIIFDNFLKDIFVKDIKNRIGARVTFSIGLDSKKEIDNVFKEYTDNTFEFNKTKVNVRLYKTATEYISRSQARRILTGLDKFKTISLDFKNIKMVGQGFSDEVFRVWKSHHPGIDIVVINANENIEFMIQRALSYNR